MPFGNHLAQGGSDNRRADFGQVCFAAVCLFHLLVKRVKVALAPDAVKLERIILLKSDAVFIIGTADPLIHPVKGRPAAQVLDFSFQRQKIPAV